MRVRAGRPEESALLSELALRSKSYWGYHAEFLEACRDELCLQPEDFSRAVVRVGEDDDGKVIGFYAISQADDGEAEVSFFFVDLPFIGKGMGRRLFDDLVEVAREAEVRSLRIDADPGAATFYERMGAERVGDVPSESIPGRLLPSYRLHVP